jgi:hypothetical protein
MDRQIVDKDGKLAGKVDDLELTFPEGDDGPPFVTAILCGPGALAGQFGGRLGKWVESLHVRLHPEQRPDPGRVSFGVVKKLDNHVELTVGCEELDVHRSEEWVRDTVIGRIPGANA